uniref:Uncharacterized protein n=1 Tax=Cryptomonas curvata TaxID=233186 RepID=A0A7S0MJ15_9CRYP|mmetsp:Transcript_4385/g.9754  ORF Transcript_4385/g.9754 Transcript_4385/m.9754 type:complete len:215 (+) Transcript_4385:34-678(+)
MPKSTAALNIISFFVLALQINCQNVVDVNQPFQCVNSVCFSVEGVNMSTVSSADFSSGGTGTRTVTAVGCLNTFNLHIWENQNVASSRPFAASDLRLCKDRSCGADKTSGIGGAWQRGADYARQCCMNAPSKRESKCDEADLYSLNPLDTFACAIFNSTKLNSTKTPFLLSTVVSYVPPLTSDIQNSGLSELCFCFGPSCPSVMSPICVKFQVL